MLWDEEQKLGISGVLLKMKPVCHYFMTMSPVSEHCCGNSVVDVRAFLGRNDFFFCLFNICLVLIFFLLNAAFILAFYLFILNWHFWLKNKFLLDVCVYIHICVHTHTYIFNTE